MNIAFFGLGNMGGPMASHLVRAGHPVRGYDVASEALQPLVALGGLAASSPKEAIQDAQIIISMLPSGQIAKELYLGADGILAHAQADTLLIDSSTIAAKDAIAMAQAAESQGLPMVDAPVSGGVAGAKAATLTFIVGGAPKALERARPVLSKMGKNIFHAGEAGAGQVAKICNNLLLAIHMIGTSEALNLGVKHGLDPKTLSEIMGQSSGANWSLQKYNPYPQVMPEAPASHAYQGGFGVKLMLKDLHLALGAANEVAAQTPLGKLAREIYQRHSQEWGERDFSSVLEYIKALE